VKLKIFTKKKELSAFVDGLKKDGRTIGLVPTMGALHEGHLSLIEFAAFQCDAVVCSIFVNPTQFNNPEDLAKYPRPISSDIEKLTNSPCDVLFMPDVEEMYHGDEEWYIDLGELESILEAKSRPGHYQGVTQIVNKLFNAVDPDWAFFGQKDYQQYLIIERMVEILKLPVRLVLCPIVREKDGLAMSSRNAHLSSKERQQALALSQAIELTKEDFESRQIHELIAEATTFLENSPGIKLDYFEICNADDLQPVMFKEDELIVLVAATVGQTRLIDNAFLT
jgi:pantoate--beta-alanine ligase